MKLCFETLGWFVTSPATPEFTCGYTADDIPSSGAQPNAGQGRLILEVTSSHTLTTPQSVGLLWTSDRPVSETST